MNVGRWADMEAEDDEDDTMRCAWAEIDAIFASPLPDALEDEDGYLRFLGDEDAGTDAWTQNELKFLGEQQTSCSMSPHGHVAVPAHDESGLAGDLAVLYSSRLSALSRTTDGGLVLATRAVLLLMRCRRAMAANERRSMFIWAAAAALLRFRMDAPFDPLGASAARMHRALLPWLRDDTNVKAVPEDATMAIPKAYRPAFESAVARFAFGAFNDEVAPPATAIYAKPPRASVTSGAARRKDRRQRR